MSEKRKHKHYNKEFKIEAVKLAETVGVMKAAAELGVAKKSIQNWINGIYMGGAQCKKSKMAEMEAELRRIKKENKNLKLINDVLKKSTAIFSKDQIGD